MSYEIADARVADMRAKVWTLTHVTFTGAAMLRREKRRIGYMDSDGVGNK